MNNCKTFHLKHHLGFVKICPPTGQITFYPILQGKNGQNRPENQQNWNMAKTAPKLINSQNKSHIWTIFGECLNYKSGLRILIWPLEVPFFWSQRLALLAKVAVFGQKIRRSSTALKVRFFGTPCSSTSGPICLCQCLRWYSNIEFEIYFLKALWRLEDFIPARQTGWLWSEWSVWGRPAPRRGKR